MRRVLSLFLVVGLLACASEHEALIEKAEHEASENKAQLAKYLYLQVLSKRKEKDHVRYRALKGLANISATQLYEYREAAAALDKLFEEFGQVAQYSGEMRNLRLMAARIWRVNLENPQRALDVLSPMIEPTKFDLELGQELGRTYLATSNYESAVHWLTQSFEAAKSSQDCFRLRSLQLDLLQTFSIQDKCDQVFYWSEVSFYPGCQPDSFSVSVERANCYEITGETAKAMAVYQEMIKKDPQNMKAHFFLESLKRREKQKLSR